MQNAQALRLAGVEITNPKSTVTALALTVVMFASGFSCNQQDAQKWLDILKQDLPVIIQMALGIAQIVTVVGAKETSDVDAVTKIGDEATNDLQTAQKWFDAYQQSPTADNKQKVEAALAATVTNLPELLAAAHIKNEKLLAQLKLAIAQIVNVAKMMLSFIPNPTTAAGKAAHATKGAAKTPPTADDLRGQWKQEQGFDLK